MTVATFTAKGQVKIPASARERCGLKAGCGHTVTFDRKAAHIPGMELV